MQPTSRTNCKFLMKCRNELNPEQIKAFFQKYQESSVVKKKVRYIFDLGLFLLDDEIRRVLKHDKHMLNKEPDSTTI